MLSRWINGAKGKRINMYLGWNIPLDLKSSTIYIYNIIFHHPPHTTSFQSVWNELIAHTISEVFCPLGVISSQQTNRPHLASSDNIPIYSNLKNLSSDFLCQNSKKKIQKKKIIIQNWKCLICFLNVALIVFRSFSATFKNFKLFSAWFDYSIKYDIKIC